MKSCSILIIHRSVGLGGAEKIIAFLANSLSEEHKVDLMLLESQEKTLEINPRVNIIQTNCYFDKPIISVHAIRGFIEFRSMIKEIDKVICYTKPNVIICFDLRIILALQFVSTQGAKLLFSERADPYDNPRYWQRILKTIYRRVDYIVFQTVGAMDFYGDIVKNKCCIIPNPAQLRTSPQVIRDNSNIQKYIFSAGRFQYRKGFDLLIDAFSIIAGSISDFELKIYGDGEKKEELIELIRKYKLENRVSLIEPINAVVENNSQAALFVLPSRSEGIPNIMIEAMAMGIPVVATDCSPGGAKLLSANGQYALIAENDNASSLAEKIMYALKHYDETIELSYQAFRSLNRFDPSSITEKWKSVIQTM